jgi:hypothetical protein
MGGGRSSCCGSGVTETQKRRPTAEPANVVVWKELHLKATLPPATSMIAFFRGLHCRRRRRQRGWSSGNHSSA